jgi:acyl-CoA reductase-like NAD-dependent aldehyde dehydrogenase
VTATARLDQAQRRWQTVPVAGRLAAIRALRGLIGTNAATLAKSSADARSRPMAESLTAEVLPLAEACRFLEKNARKLLAARSFGPRGRPLWLGGVRSEIHRDPVGIVLIIGPGNYPLFLPGVQLVQALVAGNAVRLKPGLGGSAAAAALVELIHRAGFDPELVELLPESVEAATAAIDDRPDKVVFTGSAENAQKVLARLAPLMIPAVVEASGCDSVILRADADVGLALRALRFALSLNDGATCMVPQRLFVHRDLARRMVDDLKAGLPVETFSGDDEVVARVNDCPFGLGASIFSRDRSAAQRLAMRLRTGLVTINDIIVSSADPRLPFGGRRRSGYGATRGAEGLLEMTVPKVVTHSSSRFRPAYDPVTDKTLAGILSYTRLVHATGLRRFTHPKAS